MTIRREVTESPLFQGADEVIVYTLTTTPWASSPATITAKIFSRNEATGAFTDVSSTNMAGSPSAVGDIITLAPISVLTAGTRYRVEVKFTVSGNTFEPWFWLDGER